MCEEIEEMPADSPGTLNCGDFAFNEGQCLPKIEHQIGSSSTNSHVDMAGTILDITGLKANDSALLESEAKYRRIVETSQEGIWEIDSETCTTYVNQRIAEMLGYTPEEMLGRKIRSFTFEDDIADQEYQLELRRHGNNTNFERRFIRRDGNTLYAQVSATATHDTQGNSTGSFAMLTDITERKRTAQALRESEERFRHLAEGVADIIWTTDAEDRFTYCTPAIKNILGYTQDEVMHKQRQELALPAEIEPFKATHQLLLAKRQPYRHVEYKLMHKDGHDVVLESSADPVFDTSGSFTGFRGIDRDITIWKAAQAERERLIGELSRAVAEIETLHGLLPICSGCKKIRDAQNHWTAIEQYLSQRSDINFTHSLCPDCLKALYPDLMNEANHPGDI